MLCSWVKVNILNFFVERIYFNIVKGEILERIMREIFIIIFLWCIFYNYIFIKEFDG